MKTVFRILLAGLLTTATVAVAADQPGKAVVVPLKGEISQAQFFFLRRALKDAEQGNAGLVILDMDTYGGSLDAAEQMMAALLKCPIPTVTYINPNAGSAGALVAISTRKIFMSPGSAIGAAAPVSSGGEDLPTTMNDKVISYFSAKVRSAAEKNGYNPDIAEAFINKEKEVKIGETVIHPKGSVLTFSAQEASKKVNEKPLLAAGIVSSIGELIQKENPGGVPLYIEPTGFERMAFWITALAPIFLLIGILGAYLEFKLQGTLIPGIIAAVSFLIFFAGHYIAGLAGWEVAVVFAIGLIMVISELALHPGTIIPGVAGVMLMLGALLWAMIDRYPGEPLIPTAGMLWIPLRNLGIAVVVGGFAMVWLAKILPHTSLYNRFVLGTSNPGGPSFSIGAVGSPMKCRVGDEGFAKSMLRPSGNAVFGTVHTDVVTQGEFVEPNAKIRVIAVEGSRVVVEEIRKTG